LWLCLGSIAFGAEPPKRVVTLAPSETDVVAALGAVDRLVAVGDGEDPSDLLALPRVGGMPPRWDVLAGLAPDLILADDYHRRFDADFRRFRLPVVYVAATHARTFDDVFALVRETGRLMGLDAAAEVWIATASARLRSLDSRPGAPSPRVYLEIAPRPLQAAGRESLQGHVIERAGGVNILPVGAGEMPLLSSEWVAAQAPDVILFTSASRAEEIRRRPGWSGIPAVRNNRLFLVNVDDISRAGPRSLDALDELVRILRLK
jgi:iron complex transport system substrate-binding protein